MCVQMTQFTPFLEKKICNYLSYKKKSFSRHEDSEIRFTAFMVTNWLKKYVDFGARLCVNSTKVRHGDVFFVFKCRGSDNRFYVRDAISRGASAIVWQSELFEGKKHLSQNSMNSLFALIPGGNIPNLAVSNLGFLLGPICSRWYLEPSSKMFMIGITGTNGKTSTSYWITSALESLGVSSGIVGTLGYGRLGSLSSTGYTTPDAAQLHLNLQSLNAMDVKVTSMEVSSHGLDQGRVAGVLFDIAILTNCTQDHLDYHQTLENYRLAKASLFLSSGLRLLVINCHDDLGLELIRKYVGKKRIVAYTMFSASEEMIRFSHSYDNFRLLQADHIQFDGSGLNFVLQDSCLQYKKNYEIKAPFFGFYNVENLLAVAAVCLFWGISPIRLSSILSTLPQIPGRMELINRSGYSVGPKVIIDYAHTPDALMKNLEFLVKIKSREPGRVIVIFGCGGERDASKRPIMGRIASELADLVVLTNDNPRFEDPKAILSDIYNGIDESLKHQVLVLENRAEAIFQTIKNQAQASDFVLIAGKGHEKIQYIAGKEYVFCDAEHARLALFE